MAREGRGTAGARGGIQTQSRSALPRATREIQNARADSPPRLDAGRAPLAVPIRPGATQGQLTRESPATARSARGGVCGGEGEARGPPFVRAIAPTLSRMRHLANVLEALPSSDAVRRADLQRGDARADCRAKRRCPRAAAHARAAPGASPRCGPEAPPRGPRARRWFSAPRARRCATSWRRPSGDGACPGAAISPPPMARLSRSSPPATTRSRG